MITGADIFPIKHWMLFCTIGWIAGVLLIIILSGWLDSIGIENMQFYIGTGMGAGIGFMQWLILKRNNGIGLRWLWYSIAGMTLPFIVADVIYPGQSEFKLGICVTASALLTGILQYFLLKNKFLNASQWITFGWLAWTLAALPVFLISFTMKIKGEGITNLFLALFNLMLIVSGGPILGWVTGRFFKQTQKL